VLDERDLEIVSALREDARATYADIAARVGLSASSVHERVRKLEAAGVITAYRAVVDPEALGLFVTALIAVTPLDPQQPDDLPERLADLPEVEDCLSVAGEANYILKVRTRSTNHLEELIRRLREKAGVSLRIFGLGIIGIHCFFALLSFSVIPKAKIAHFPGPERFGGQRR